MDVISYPETGIVSEAYSTFDIEPDVESSDSDAKIVPNVDRSSESSFQRFIDGFTWDAENIKTPKEAKRLGKSLVAQINKSRRPNLKKVQTVMLKRSCVFYNGKWLRKLKAVKRVKKKKKMMANKSVQTNKTTEDHGTQVEMRCECNNKMTNVIFETIYPPYFY